MNQDIECPTPTEILELRKMIECADGVWVFSPEYNRNYPGTVKNLFDWLLRPIDPRNKDLDTAIKGKKITVSGIGGKRATADMRAKLHELLEVIGTEPMPQAETGLMVNSEAWQTDEVILTDEQKQALRNQASEFLKFI